MRNTEHPAYHSVARKVARFHSLLSNFEQPLRDDGFAFDEEYRWAGNHLMALSELSDPPGKQPPKISELRAAEAELEPELFRRMEAVLKFLYARVPDHPWYPDYRLYFQLWRECYGEPIRPLSAEDLKHPEDADTDADEPSLTPTIHGVPYEFLEAALQRFAAAGKKPKLYCPLMIFISGLLYTTGHVARHGELPAHEFDDGLLENARAALASAVDFANEPGTIAMAESQPHELFPTGLHLLFMAVYHITIAHEAAVYEWLFRDGAHNQLRHLTSLLFAMGVRSLSDPYAKNLITPWVQSCERMNDWLSDEEKILLHQFSEGDFTGGAA